MRSLLKTALCILAVAIAAFIFIKTYVIFHSVAVVSIFFSALIIEGSQYVR